jgi:A/G-specific adenine glycosylase
MIVLIIQWKQMFDDRLAADFQATVWEYYHDHGRNDLPWRIPEPDGRFDPYRILVSEVMLQQTQVARVVPKYHDFLERFPSVSVLAAAEQGEVLRAWSGLGYNRRAKYLRASAQSIVAEHKGEFPTDAAQLVKLPGIGANTAGAILAYAFNLPATFLETNIRAAYIHHFFQARADIHDREILEIVRKTMDCEHPREWYWALMDYGSYLKRSGMKLNMLSKSYTRQTKFDGSQRQIRGQVIRLLGAGPLTDDRLAAEVPDPRLGPVVEELLREGLISRSQDGLTL